MWYFSSRAIGRLIIGLYNRLWPHGSSCTKPCDIQSTGVYHSRAQAQIAHRSSLPLGCEGHGRSSSSGVSLPFRKHLPMFLFLMVVQRPLVVEALPTVRDLTRELFEGIDARSSPSDWLIERKEVLRKCPAARTSLNREKRSDQMCWGSWDRKTLGPSPGLPLTRNKCVGRRGSSHHPIFVGR